jgi:hypothetical protein
VTSLDAEEAELRRRLAGGGGRLSRDEEELMRRRLADIQQLRATLQLSLLEEEESLQRARLQELQSRAGFGGEGPRSVSCSTDRNARVLN